MHTQNATKKNYFWSDHFLHNKTQRIDLVQRRFYEAHRKSPEVCTICRKFGYRPLHIYDIMTWDAVSIIHCGHKKCLKKCKVKTMFSFLHFRELFPKNRGFWFWHILKYDLKIFVYCCTHLQNKRFALKFKFRRNASKFPIFI